MKSSAVNPEDIVEWMEGFLSCYPSQSVNILIRSFKQEIERNDIKHRIHLRRLPEGKQALSNLQRLRYAAPRLSQGVSLPVQPTQRESGHRV
jgi:hypothetical protein